MKNTEQILIERLAALQKVTEKVIVSWINHEKLTKELFADLADECRAADELLHQYEK